MAYRVKELYYTLQGEGAQAGRAAVFCRFEGCNLWSGREEDRARAICNFCDTDFVGTDGPGGGVYESAEALAHAIRETWRGEPGQGRPYVVFTGGEPLLQLDTTLVTAVHDLGVEVGVETNGTRPAPDGIDWLCISPKAGAKLLLNACDELKLVYPQCDALPHLFNHLIAGNRFLQPMAGPAIHDHVASAVEYCKEHPHWRLSLQTHKLIGIP